MQKTVRGRKSPEIKVTLNGRPPITAARTIAKMLLSVNRANQPSLKTIARKAR